MPNKATVDAEYDFVDWEVTCKCVDRALKNLEINFNYHDDAAYDDLVFMYKMENKIRDGTTSANIDSTMRNRES